MSNQSTPPAPDLALAALARRQHGVWSRRQAVRVGLSDAMIRTRVARGDWIRLDNAVYAHTTSLPTWHRALSSAVRAEPWAVVSHRAAAALHGFTGFRPGFVEITIRPGANARGSHALAHRGSDVETTRLASLPVTTVAQTFIDLAQITTTHRLSAALDHRAATNPSALDPVRERYAALAPRGGRNLRPLRAALLRYGDGQVPTASELERMLRSVLSAPTIPPVLWEAPFPGRRPGTQRIDALVPDWRLVVEADGRAWHTRVDDFESDRRRDAEAAAAGYQTLRFTWQHLRREQRWVTSMVTEAGAHRHDGSTISA